MEQHIKEYNKNNPSFDKQRIKECSAIRSNDVFKELSSRAVSHQRHLNVTAPPMLTNSSAISLPQQTSFKSLKFHINWDTRIWNET